MKKNQQSILLVDDEEIVLATVSDSLRKEGYKVTTALTAEEGLGKFKKAPCDLVITDLIMEKKNGLELSGEIKKLNPATPIMILTGYPSLNTAIEALKLGARDYLIKPCGRKELLQKVETCLKRNDEISEISDFTTQTMTKFQEAGLTHREIEVCILVQNGVNNKEIASRFCISLHTVKNHLKKIHSKLGTHNRTELAVLLNQQK